MLAACTATGEGWGPGQHCSRYPFPGWAPTGTSTPVCSQTWPRLARGLGRPVTVGSAAPDPRLPCSGCRPPPPRQGSRPLQKGPHWGLVLLIRSLPFNYPQVHARHLWGCLNPTLTSCAVGVEGGGHRHQGSEWGGTGSRSHSRESRAGFEPCPGWLHSLLSSARGPCGPLAWLEIDRKSVV